MSLILSTSWNASRHRRGKPIIKQINQLGFKELELSFNLTPFLVKEILADSRKSGLKVKSLHNYCPIPSGLSRKQALPDCYSLSSLGRQERALAVKYAKISIDTAFECAADAVVLHCGRVQIPDRTRDLIGLLRRGAGKSKLFKSIQQEHKRDRYLNQNKFFVNALRSLDELNSYAQKRKVRLGVETRFYYREIPSFEEFAIILDRFKKSSIYYWHDTGHAQVMEDLGFAKHKDFLDSYATDLLGIHLHDVKKCNDHLAPTGGEVDFGMLRPYLKKKTLKVFEAHYPATAEDIRKGKEYLENEFHGLL